MIQERIFTPGLAQVAYLIADEAAGVAAIIDPRRDVGTYLDWAAAHRVRIVAALETHIHADFVSGARELAAMGATVYTSRIGSVAYTDVPLDDDDEVTIGSLRFRALATPGHTPEHLAFLLFDPAVGSQPVALYSGDALFVGEVGRPDLLGEAETQQLARQLYHTVTNQLATLDDMLVVYPGHTAGSACGKKIGDAPFTTIGQEKVTNYAFKARSEGAFVAMVLTGLQTPPTYYPVLKRLNKEGTPLLRDLPDGVPLTPTHIARSVAGNGVVIDARTEDDFGAGHLPGALFAGLGANFSAWMGWLAPYDRDLILVLTHEGQFADAQTELRRIGLDNVVGYLAGGIETWRDEGLGLETLPQVSPCDLATRMASGANGLAALDVRSDDEWKAGHIKGAMHCFAGEIAQGIAPTSGEEQPLALVCGSGYRSSVVASLLHERGYRHLVNVRGGMEAWEAANLPEQTE